VHVICTDKTGTLTQNRLAVTALRDPIDGGEFTTAQRATFLRQAMVASDVHETENGLGGDPLDVAVAEARRGDSEDVASVLVETEMRFSFDDDKRRAGGVTRSEDGDGYLYCVKGAWESLRPLLSQVESPDGTTRDLTEQHLEAAERVVQNMASSGQRVLALAYRTVDQLPEGEGAQEQLEQQLTLKGFMGSEDPIRENVPGAVARCHGAGIDVVMITGDHPATAEAIARQAGIINADSPPGTGVISGEELARIGKRALVARLRSGVHVFARTTPEQKWKVVSAFHELNKVVAMTGDGVNDAPALKAADVGIAMGRSGTDVAREAAQVILLDDNFASIVNGIEEGRTIFNNIRKFTNYVLVSNGPEILPYILYIVFPVPLGLTIIQILAIDLCTDIIPSMGLGQEKPDPEVMQQPPRDKQQKLLSLPLIAHSYLFLGLIEAAFAMSLFFWVLTEGGWQYGAELSVRDPLYLSATGITLSSIILMQIGNLFGRRSRTGSGLSLDFLSNPLLVLGLLFEAVLSWAILYFAPLAKMLGTGPVDGAVYAVAWIGPFLIFALDYLRKRVLALLRARGMEIPSG
ncbi:MAG: cation-transporting P-type ATPase, partial [Chromatocurvus sp.]